MKRKYLHQWALGLFTATALFSSCKKDFDEAIPELDAARVQSDTVYHNAFEAFPGKKGLLKKGTFRGQPITYMDYDGVALWQGDIRLSKEELAPIDTSGSDRNARVRGFGTALKDRRWFDGVIPYEIGPGLNNARINAAMKAWEQNTPIRFVPRSNQTDYVRFEYSTVNMSYVGRIGGKQTLDILNDDLGVMVHEIGHLIGLDHEHSRSDRDNFVTFNKLNLRDSEFASQYAPFTSASFDHGPFDYKSIMIYGSYQFAKKNSAGSFEKVLTYKNGAVLSDNLSSGKQSVGDERTVTAMYSNIYVVQNDHLYAVSPMGGQYYTSLGGGWKGAAQTLAEDDRYIWAIQNGKLWRADRLSGNYQKMGNGDWTGAVGITGKDPQGNMYAQAGDHLWKIFPNGNFTHLPIPGGGTWKGTRALYYLNGSLWVIWKNGHIFKVNTTTGSYQEMIGGWSDVKAMAAVRRSATNLYIVNGSDLYKFDTNTGQRTYLKTGYFNTTAMTGVGGRLYIASDGWLHKTDENGSKIWAVSGYSGVTSMGATHFSGLFD